MNIESPLWSVLLWVSIRRGHGYVLSNDDVLNVPRKAKSFRITSAVACGFLNRVISICDQFQWYPLPIILVGHVAPCRPDVDRFRHCPSRAANTDSPEHCIREWPPRVPRDLAAATLTGRAGERNHAKGGDRRCQSELSLRGELCFRVDIVVAPVMT